LEKNIITTNSKFPSIVHKFERNFCSINLYTTHFGTYSQADCSCRRDLCMNLK
uniref:Uncharacterized protein n=1 Tax=Parascaris equorum TaxID=6256 RepID=A0A914RI69_PAREQ